MTTYTCGRCGGTVSKSTKTCPHCFAHLAYIKCQSCGFTGSESDFYNDRCPKCGSVVYTGGGGSGGNNSSKGWGIIIGIIVVIAIAILVIIALVNK